MFSLQINNLYLIRVRYSVLDRLREKQDVLENNSRDIAILWTALY